MRPNTYTSSARFFGESGLPYSTEASHVATQSPRHLFDEGRVTRDHGEVIELSDVPYSCNSSSQTRDEQKVEGRPDVHYTIGHLTNIPKSSLQMNITTGNALEDCKSIENDREFNRKRRQLQEKQQACVRYPVTGKELDPEKIENKDTSLQRQSITRVKRIEGSSVEDEDEPVPGTFEHSFFRRSVKNAKHSKSSSTLCPPNLPSDSIEFRLNLVDLHCREDFRLNYLKKLSYA